MGPCSQSLWFFEELQDVRVAVLLGDTAKFSHDLFFQFAFPIIPGRFRVPRLAITASHVTCDPIEGIPRGLKQYGMESIKSKSGEDGSRDIHTFLDLII